MRGDHETIYSNYSKFSTRFFRLVSVSRKHKGDAKAITKLGFKNEKLSKICPTVSNAVSASRYRKNFETF